MKFHDIASFLFFRRRGAIPTEALSVSPAQHRYLEQERRIRRQIFACRVLFLILFLVSWEVSARIGILNDFIFSSPSRVLSCFLSMAADWTIFYHTGITILETMLSFFLVTCIGIFGAVALWSSRRLAKILEPYLVMLNSLPKSALAPVLIVWLGNNMKTIITAAVSVAVFGSILTLYNGFLSMDPDQIRLIYTLGGKQKDVLTKVLLPGSVPLIISNMKVNIGLCLVGVIIGEFLSAQAGLGFLIIYGSQVFKLDLVIMSIVILCVLSAVLYQAVTMLEKKVCAASLSRMYATFNAGISCQTSKNTIREFPLVIATVAKVSRKRGLWLVVRVNKKTAHVLLPCRQSEFCVLSVIYYVTVQYLHTYRNLPRSFPSDAWQVTSKNPFQIGFADGIFAFRPMFYYGQRSKCADLLNSYFITF